MHRFLAITKITSPRERCEYCDEYVCLSVRSHNLIPHDLHTVIHKSQPNSLITLTFRSHHKTFIRRSWYSVLPDLDVIKKTVGFMPVAYGRDSVLVWRRQYVMLCTSGSLDDVISISQQR